MYLGKLIDALVALRDSGSVGGETIVYIQGGGNVGAFELEEIQVTIFNNHVGEEGLRPSVCLSDGLKPQKE